MSAQQQEPYYADWSGRLVLATDERDDEAMASAALREAGQRALTDAANAFANVWGDSDVPAPLVYQALRDRAKKLGKDGS